MKVEVLKTIEKIIETPFVEDEFEVGSVCFANDEDLRADFKLQFSTYDVVNYVYGIYQLLWEENEKIEISLLKIPYPISASSFWQYSSIGKKFRQEHPIQEMEFIVVSELNWESV
ncbi:hypothetical protein [Flavobacterium undicola]|uniref:hypothetical protein n=1 Tax=Flavobacterium undicola TaxID=1932779 RepID=UPI001376791D|nr:hypothetical protein [Flavobacterium undicola]MBA0882423.1 hypothetical protein [Flavobacterium undicola]